LGFRRRKRGLTEVYRSKAATALEGRPRQAKPPRRPTKRAYRARVTEEFGWVPEAGGPLTVQCVRGIDGWFIRVTDGAPGEGFRIVLRGRPESPWVLGDTTVTLVGGGLRPDVFIGAWRAFELELNELDLKADLVQLCGYYHDRPSFGAEMTILDPDPDPHWGVLRNVVEGAGTRAILSGAEVARLWGCDEKDVLPHALWLRSIGYEARNHKTNHQIPKGSYLIPYAFPTLTRLSVQLRKSLVEDR
jgi:DNA (cytosine-5)-methyltransferase 1